MARKLDRIWVRFGLAIAVTIVVSMAVLAGILVLFWELDYNSFYNTLPTNIRTELDELNALGLDEGPRAMQIYGEYWEGDPIRGEMLALIFAMLLGLPFGMGIGFFVSRLVTRPLGSMAEAANRVAVGDFTVRAHPGHAKGEMADMLNDFNHMIDSLAALDEERRLTVASLSHELRTPLAVLSARLHGICDGVIPATDEEMHGLLEQSLHLGRLITDLHTISLATTGRLSLQYEQLDLAVLVQDEMAQFAARLQEQDFEHTVVLPKPEDSALILADPDRMRQVVANLFENALRHAASGRWMGVAVHKEQDRMRLEVSDAGPGLPESMKDKPFERFPHRSVGAASSSGLGLSIVHALVEQQGGWVYAKASERGGACIGVSFPIAAQGTD
ncbi:sensor histidine kinase [Kerstersia sp.]|uniref:sensor histidine kinase n=1 Tax=Kerstersia sp. TaxID=1930783 RepID=UPI003F8EC02F